MHKLYTFLILSFLTAIVWAQSPQKMSYQAVVRDEGNTLVVNKPVGARMSIVQGSDNGNTVYSEIFNPNRETNANGLLTLEIGGGIPVSGIFSEIDWSEGPYFIRTEIDPSGGSNYTVTGTSQLLSVPFAFHAQTVEFDKVDDADNDPTNEIQTLSLSGLSLSLSRGGGTVALPAAEGDNWGSEYVRTDATLSGQGTTASPLMLARQSASTGQVLKWNGTSWVPATDETGSGGSNPTGTAGGDLSGTYPNPTIGAGKITEEKIAGNSVTSAKIADGTIAADDLGSNAVTTDKINAGAVTGAKIASGAVTGAKIAQAGATSGQVLKWNGTSWVPATDETGSGDSNPTGPAGGDLSGTYPNPTIGAGKITEEKIAANSVTSAKILDGTIVAADIANNAITEAKIASGAVTGAKIAQAGATSGQTLKWTGTTWAPGDDEAGGLTLPFLGSVSSSGNAFYVQNEGSGGGINVLTYGGIGVFGEVVKTTGINYGVRGQSNSSEGRGVLGYASSFTGPNYGVVGISESNEGTGVYGLMVAAAGYTYGVRGQVGSSSGTGVFGEATNTTGTTYGVRGASSSSSGRGVYGEATSTTGYNYGVYGVSASSDGIGISGFVSSTTGRTYGVNGVSMSTSGVGVRGASSGTGTVYGVLGETWSQQGAGIHGKSWSMYTGTIGVKGTVSNNGGFSGHFSGGKFYVEGRVGLGTESPATTLHVRHGTLGQNVPPTEGLRLHNSGANNNSWTLYTVNSNGHLQLYANNTLRGTFSATNGTYTSSSNRRLKTDITALNENILDRVMHLQPVSYRFISHPQPTPTIGFIAEDTLPLFPELVESTGENDESLGVNYAAFSVVAIKAIQLQQKQIEALQTENEQLKKRLERLELIVASTPPLGMEVGYVPIATRQGAE